MIIDHENLWVVYQINYSKEIDIKLVTDDVREANIKESILKQCGNRGVRVSRLEEMYTDAFSEGFDSGYEEGRG